METSRLPSRPKRRLPSPGRSTRIEAAWDDMIAFALDDGDGDDCIVLTDADLIEVVSAE